jgi:hypothetical protein
VITKTLLSILSVLKRDPDTGVTLTGSRIHFGTRPESEDDSCQQPSSKGKLIPLLHLAYELPYKEWVPER